jgi:hypothetical protein
MRARLGSFLGGIALWVVLLSASAASAATLVGDYQLQGSLASSGAGPALSEIAPGSAFQSDDVMGVSRQVLAFPSGNGLQMSPVGLSGSTYSVVTTFKFTSGLAPPQDYARILDATNGTSDVGLYDHLGFLDFFDITDYQQGSSAVFADDAYVTVAVVASGGTNGYINGAPNNSYPGLYGVQGNTLRFFKDDSNEDSAGAVSCIRVYDGVLTDAEIAGIGASPTCGTVTPTATPTTPTPTKKKKRCRKKHKKRSADSAKKKKCKKHKKR